MATNAAISEPQFDAIFTDRGWRAAFAGQTGVVCDSDGSAFNLTLPAEGATAELGSATQPSRLVVDGYGLEVAQGATQSLDIPASSGGGTNGRTDLIVARLDLTTFTGDPGPVRLDRIPGTEGSTARPAPTYDPDGVRDLPLYAVRRRQGESLNQAIVTDLRPRIGVMYDVPASGSLPDYAPLGSRAARGDVVYRMDSVGSAVDWVVEKPAPTHLTGGQVTQGSAFPGWITESECSLDSDGFWVKVHIEVEKNGSLIIAGSNGAIPGHTDIVTLRDGWAPGAVVTMSGYVENDSGNRRDAGARINSVGRVTFTSTQPGAEVRRVVLDAFYPKGA